MTTLGISVALASASRCGRRAFPRLRRWVGAALVGCAPPAMAEVPAWWHEESLLQAGRCPQNSSPATVGQLRNVAAAARRYLDRALPAGAGPQVEDALSRFLEYNPGPSADANRALLTQGQLKRMAQPFYDRMLDCGLTLNQVRPGSPEPPWRYPWASAHSQEADGVPAQIGQLKWVFGFSVAPSSAPTLPPGVGHGPDARNLPPGPPPTQHTPRLLASDPSTSSWRQDMGFYFTGLASEGWIFHWDHGWLYNPWRTDELTVFFDQTHGWLFSSTEYYPWIYSFMNRDWIRFEGGQAGSSTADGASTRWFFYPTWMESKPDPKVVFVGVERFQWAGSPYRRMAYSHDPSRFDPGRPYAEIGQGWFEDAFPWGVGAQRFQARPREPRPIYYIPPDRATGDWPGLNLLQYDNPAFRGSSFLLGSDGLFTHVPDRFGGDYVSVGSGVITRYNRVEFDRAAAPQDYWIGIKQTSRGHRFITYSLDPSELDPKCRLHAGVGIAAAPMDRAATHTLPYSFRRSSFLPATQLKMVYPRSWGESQSMVRLPAWRSWIAVDGPIPANLAKDFSVDLRGADALGRPVANLLLSPTEFVLLDGYPGSAPPQVVHTNIIFPESVTYHTYSAANPSGHVRLSGPQGGLSSLGYITYAGNQFLRHQTYPEEPDPTHEEDSLEVRITVDRTGLQDALPPRTERVGYREANLVVGDRGVFLFSHFDADGVRNSSSGSFTFDRLYTLGMDDRTPHADFDHTYTIDLDFAQEVLVCSDHFALPLRSGKSFRFTFRPGEVEESSFAILRPAILVDANRDGQISRDSSDAVSESTPFRFWINDDNDVGPSSGDDRPGQPPSTADYANAEVDSVRDLVDFFPVFLDLRALLHALPEAHGLHFRLRQDDGALNFVYTDRSLEEATAIYRRILESGFGPHFNQPAGAASVTRITQAGVSLSHGFIDRIRFQDGGVLLLEGRSPSTRPLVLEMMKGGELMAVVPLPLSLSPVEDMFRHIDLTGVPRDYDGSRPVLPHPPPPSRLGSPPNWPDNLSRNRYFVFLHGYKVDADRARGWQAEVFKRLHLMGHQARFVGLTWHGATGMDYHRAVFHAFQTGDVLRSALDFTGSYPLTLAAHSLGNMVASHALRMPWNRRIRYFMINAAVPIEAYGSLDLEDRQFFEMTEMNWRPFDRRLFASRWHRLVAEEDARRQLAWSGCFEGVRKHHEMHNYYSEEEDVVANVDDAKTASILAAFMRQGFDFATGAWKLQELVKGVSWSSSLAAAFMERGQGGWDFNKTWFVRENPPGPAGQTGGIRFRRRTPAEAATIPSPQLIAHPFFSPFLEANLTQAEDGAASDLAAQPKVRYDLLARAIPAMSYAVAANRLPSLEDRNYDMPTLGRVKELWPLDGHEGENQLGRWLHSDLKNVALPYVHLLYAEMIRRESEP